MAKKETSPPAGNTGAENTSRSGLRALVDWLSVTFKDVDNVQDICDIFGLELSSFEESKKGGKGYLRAMRFGGISIYYEGSEGMGINIELTGQGCRHFETYSRYDWLSVLSVLLLRDVNITRLDLAIDDFKGYFSLKQIREKIRRQCVRSRFKDSIEIKKTRLADGETRGETIYFGSVQSMIQIRFYNKILEREERGHQVDSEIDHWVRTEIQMRDERAMAAVMLFVHQTHDTGNLATGILKNYLNFLVPNKDKNKNRWKVCSWWEKFLGDVDKLQLSVQAPDQTIERSYKWLDKQVETTMAMMYEAFDQDLTVFFDLINKGIGRMEPKHRDVVLRFKRENEGLSYQDFLRKSKKDLNLG